MISAAAQRSAGTFRAPMVRSRVGAARATSDLRALTGLFLGLCRHGHNMWWYQMGSFHSNPSPSVSTGEPSRVGNARGSWIDHDAAEMSGTASDLGGLQVLVRTAARALRPRGHGSVSPSPAQVLSSPSPRHGLASDS